MESTKELHLGQQELSLQQLEDPSLYQKYLDYRIESICENWRSTKWLLQSIFSFVAFIQIFVNGFKDSESIIDCFSCIIWMFITEILYQLRRFKFMTYWSGQVMIILYSVHFTEIALCEGQPRIYPGMLWGVSIQFLLAVSLSVHVKTAPLAMALGNLYTMIRFCMHDVSSMGNIMMPALVSPIVFMYLTWYLFYQYSTKEFLRSQNQIELIKKFRSILKEFPEQILVTKYTKEKLYFQFANNESIFR